MTITEIAQEIDQKMVARWKGPDKSSQKIKQENVRKSPNKPGKS